MRKPVGAAVDPLGHADNVVRVREPVQIVLDPEEHGRMYGVLRRDEIRLGDARTSVHILRHTFCSHLAMRGAPESGSIGCGYEVMDAGQTSSRGNNLEAAKTGR